MTKDEEIKDGLRSSGVPDLTFGTTLVKEGAPELRQLILTGALAKRGGNSRGLYLHPKTRNSVGQARKVFYLVAKELFLSGHPICCLPVTRLVDAINSDDMTGEAFRVERARMVMVLDFYEDSAGFPFSTQDAAKLRAWVRKKFESGSAVSFLGDGPLERCTPWWPSSFLGFIQDNVVIHSV